MSALHPYLVYWRRQQQRDSRRRHLLTEHARRAVDRITALLVRRFGAKRVILFGSLAQDHFRAGSDIDLAVEGLPGDEFFPALAAVNRLTGFWVDLKPWEEVQPHFRQRLIQTGKVIYEGSDPH